MFPTLTTMWMYPYMMPELTIHPPVSKFVLNGADLMLPGVIVPANGVIGLGSVSKGQKRCIKIEGNPYPIAVGKMLVNQSQMEKLKGKGLEVLHVYKDTLWAHAGKAVPNAGFSEKEDEITPCGDSSWKPGAAAAAPEANADGGASPAAASAASPTEGGDASPAAASPSGGGDATTPAAQAEGGAVRAAADWTQDDLLDYCFVRAFTVADLKLPVEASDLLEKHMKPSAPEGTTLDVKKSSHKQIGKYFNSMRKAKVIDVKENKQVVSVTKVHVDHKTFKQLEEKFAGELKAGAAASAPEAEAKGAAAAGLPPPKVTTVWKATHYTEPFFKAVGKSKSDLYPWEEVSAALASYTKAQSLDLEGGEVKLNEDLITWLYRAAGAQKKDLTFPESVEREELEEKLKDRMHEHTIIDVSGVGPTTRKGPPVKLEVSLSRKGAHNVTRIANLEAFGLDPTALGDELKRKLNTQVYIEDMPGKNTKDKLLQLQGHADKEFEAFLKERYGIPKSMFSVNK